MIRETRRFRKRRERKDFFFFFVYFACFVDPAERVGSGGRLVESPLPAKKIKKN